MSDLFRSTWFFWALGSFLNLFHYKIWDWCYIKKKFWTSVHIFLLTCTWSYIDLAQWFSTLAVTLGSPGGFKNSWCPFSSLDHLNQNFRMRSKHQYFLNSGHSIVQPRLRTTEGKLVFMEFCLFVCCFFVFCILLRPRSLKVICFYFSGKSSLAIVILIPKYWEHNTSLRTSIPNESAPSAFFKVKI